MSSQQRRPSTLPRPPGQRTSTVRAAQPLIRTRLGSAPTQSNPPIRVKLRSSSTTPQRPPAARDHPAFCSAENADAIAPAKLERVLGCSTLSPTSFAGDGKGTVAHIAGCTVVITFATHSRQAHLISPTKSPLTCCAFSPDGKLLATGEAGHQPCVRVWRLFDESDPAKFIGRQLHACRGHDKHVAALAWLSGARIVSVGNQFDCGVYLFDANAGKELWSSKHNVQVNALAVSPDGETVVTVGSRHVKYWTLSSGSRGASLASRSAILSSFRYANFVDVAFMTNKKLIAVLADGQIAELVDKKLTATFDPLPNARFTCVSVRPDEGDIIVGCSDGVARVLSPADYSVQRAISSPHYLTSTYQSSSQPALKHDAENLVEVHAVLAHAEGRVAVAMADRTISHWQPSPDGERSVVLTHCGQAHSGAVCDVQILPPPSPFTPGSFLTAGQDGTIRLWSMAEGEESHLNPLVPKRVVYVAFDPAALAASRDGQLPSENESEVRCMRVSPDGQHLTLGTRDGRVNVIDLADPELPTLMEMEAHEKEVTCLEYSQPGAYPYLLASGGRDRIVHVFLPSEGYQHVYTIGDHNGSIVALKFLQTAASFLMFTCAADKAIVIRRLVQTEQSMRFERVNQISHPISFTDLAIAGSAGEEQLVAACADRTLRCYDLAGKPTGSVRGTGGDHDTGNGQISTMCLDPSGLFTACASTDKQVYVVESATGTVVATAAGLGEGATALAFSNDCRRLLISSNNGCVFVWRLAKRLTARMLAARREKEEKEQANRSVSPDSVLDGGSEPISDEPLSHRDVDTSESSSSQFGSVGDLRQLDATHESIVLPTADQGPTPLVRRENAVNRLSSSNLLLASQSNLSTADSDVADPDSPHPSTSNQQLGSAGNINQLSPMFGVEPRLGAYQHSKSMHEMSRQIGEMNIERRDDSPRRTRRKWAVDKSQTTIYDPSTLVFDAQPAQAQQYPFDSSYPSAPSTHPHQPSSLAGSTSPTASTVSSAASPNLARTQTDMALLQGLVQTQIHSGQYGAPRTQYMNSSLSQQQRTSASPGIQLTPVRGPTYRARDPLSSLDDSPQQRVPSVERGGFQRADSRRQSLSKKYIDGENRTVWTPAQMRRTNSNMTYAASPAMGGASVGGASPMPAGVVASAIGRRQSELLKHAPLRSGSASEERIRRRSLNPAGHGSGSLQGTPARAGRNADDYTASSLHLRSRSQSPNKLLQQTGSGGNPRRQRQDSDMSYTTLASSRMTPASSRTNLRGEPETRRSSNTLNQLMEMRKQLRQSQENLMFAAEGTSPLQQSRSRSITNLRANQLETFGTFDADERKKYTGSQSNLAHSRLLARSMGQLNGEEGEPESPASRLSQTMNALRKASNPDLTEQSQFIDDSSPLAPLKKRGAVQKKVERFHPRNRAARQETSGESDSNSNGDSPLPQQQPGKRYFGSGASGQRSASTLSSTPRRLFESQRHGSNMSPRRVPNYLAQKMEQSDMPAGPDLGSDESPRSGASPADWMSQLEGCPRDTQQLAAHMRDCIEGFRTHCDKMLQAAKMLTDAGISGDHKEIIMGAATRAKEQEERRWNEAVSKSERRPTEDSENGNVYNRTSLPAAGVSLDANFLQTHGAQLMELLQKNLKQ